ncbi:MAG: cyclopropane fatty acyl phospholipid synthase [Candidatus Acidiferrales bacterium]
MQSKNTIRKLRAVKPRHESVRARHPSASGNRPYSGTPIDSTRIRRDNSIGQIQHVVSGASQVFENSLKRRAEALLAHADIRIGGDRPWDIIVHRPEFYPRVFREGSLGLGESYMDGWWDCHALDQFFDHLFHAHLDRRAFPAWGAIRLYLQSLLLNPQKQSRSFQVGEGHYDLGNDLFQAMLDKRMVYTCACWDAAADLDSAQEAKLEFVCRAIGAHPGMKILDIGCGWGSFAKYAAEKYCAHVTGLTVSREQAQLARERCSGLPVEILLQDYREQSQLRKQFDGVVSLGMFEHVGCKNYRTFMEVVRQALAGCGRFYLSCIGKNVSVRSTDPWIEKYIFPNSMLPSIKQIGAATEGLFVMEELQNWGLHYDRTLMAWFQNFEDRWNELSALYDQSFFRMWKFYLMASAGSFRSRRLQAWQMLFSPEGAKGC